MWSRLGWIGTTGGIAFLLWQLSVNAPIWPPTVCAVLLVVISLLAGLSIGAVSAAKYMTDMHRLNKVLSEQNGELQDANAILLKQVSAALPASRIAS